MKDYFRYSNDELLAWTKPLSDTEDQKCENAVSMIKKAVDNDNDLKKYDIEVFLQGSYANNTNVKHSSDVDICVMARAVWWSSYPKGLDKSDYGFYDSPLDYDTYKNKVYDAMCKEFGKEYVSWSNKCIDIAANSYHVNADVVPAYMYKNYSIIDSRNSAIFVEGIKYITRENRTVINYPKLHHSNGIKKNNKTNNQYKKIVRIMKHILDNMKSDHIVDDSISSFLIECLIYNVPDIYFDSDFSWNDIIKMCLYYMNTKMDENWKEVNGIIPIFSNDRKWSFYSVKDFIQQCQKYLFKY